jgi:hypothetical protein
MFFQCIGEVYHVVHVSNFYAKVVNHQAESDVVPDVPPESKRVFALVELFGGEALFKYEDPLILTTDRPFCLRLTGTPTPPTML